MHAENYTSLSLTRSPVRVLGELTIITTMEAEVAGEQYNQQKDDAAVFQDLDAYPWDKDTEFQVSVFMNLPL